MKNDRMNLSYSKITTLQDCPRRFFYSYILQLEEEPMAVNYGDLGSRAHLVLEEFYQYIDLDAPDIEKNFNDVLGILYHKHFSDGIVDIKGNMAIGIKNFCNREIKRFNELKDKNLFKPRYSEIALECDICGWHFRGRLDAVYTNPDKTLKLCDYKFTGSNKISAPQEVQAVIYIEMMKQKYDIDINKYYFWFLRHGMGKTGRGYEKVINVTPEIKNNVYDIINHSGEIIEAGEYKRKDKYDFFCTNFCQFYGTCIAEELGIDFEDDEFED